MLLSTSSILRMAETEKELVVRKTQHKKGVAKKTLFKFCFWDVLPYFIGNFKIIVPTPNNCGGNRGVGTRI